MNELKDFYFKLQWPLFGGVELFGQYCWRAFDETNTV